MALKKIEPGGSSQVPPVVPQTRQQKVIQWTVTYPKYKLHDLILDSGTLAMLLEVISYFENRELLFITWGLAERFSQEDGLAVNLYGPPGTGKTMAAHAISEALHKKMICVDYAEIESKYVGETSKNLSRLFKPPKNKIASYFLMKLTPC